MFSTLSDLVSSRQVEEQVGDVNRNHDSDLASVKQIVSEALADLADKLGDKGALEGIMHVMGIDHLDLVHDDSGVTVLQRLQAETDRYVATINKLMLEVDAASNKEA